MTVEVEKKGPITIVTINRPEVRNCVNRETQEALVEAWESFDRDPDAKVGIFCGKETGFCAGADHKAGGAPQADAVLDLEGGRLGLIKNAQAFISLHKLDVPVIAAVNGACVGGGFDLACLCDMIVGSTAARYQVAYAKRGLYPDMGGFWSIPRAIGYKRAIEMMTTGRFMSAQEAHDIGLTNYLVEPEELEAKTMELAEQVEAAGQGRRPPRLLTRSRLFLSSRQRSGPAREAGRAGAICA